LVVTQTFIFASNYPKYNTQVIISSAIKQRPLVITSGALYKREGKGGKA